MSVKVYNDDFRFTIDATIKSNNIFTMKRTRHILFSTILFFAIHISGFAQTMNYEYDSQGNVISRTVQENSISKLEDEINPGVKIDKDDESIKINISESTDAETNVQIYDFIEKRTFTGSEYSIDLTPYPKGMYIIEIKHAKETYTEKIFKD